MEKFEVISFQQAKTEGKETPLYEIVKKSISNLTKQAKPMYEKFKASLLKEITDGNAN